MSGCSGRKACSCRWDEIRTLDLRIQTLDQSLGHRDRGRDPWCQVRFSRFLSTEFAGAGAPTAGGHVAPTFRGCPRIDSAPIPGPAVNAPAVRSCENSSKRTESASGLMCLGPRASRPQILWISINTDKRARRARSQGRLSACCWIAFFDSSLRAGLFAVGASRLNSARTPTVGHPLQPGLCIGLHGG